MQGLPMYRNVGVLRQEDRFEAACFQLARDPDQIDTIGGRPDLYSELHGLDMIIRGRALRARARTPRVPRPYSAPARFGDAKDRHRHRRAIARPARRASHAAVRSTLLTARAARLRPSPRRSARAFLDRDRPPRTRRRPLS